MRLATYSNCRITRRSTQVYGMVENAGTGYRIRIPDTGYGYRIRIRIQDTDTEYGYRIRIPDSLKYLFLTLKLLVIVFLVFGFFLK